MRPAGAGEQVQSAIDLGTNTILMVTGRRGRGGAVEIRDDAHAIARLGKGVDAGRRIRPDTLERVCALLADYRRRAEGHGAQRIRAFGTSALRDADNKCELIAAVAERTGLELVELSGDQEARLTFAGAGFGLRLPARYAVVDIGGGSTELALGSGDGAVERSQSVDVGAVRVAERFFPHLPPTAGQRRDARAMVDGALRALFAVPAGVTVVGVAGTVTTLAALDLRVSHFDAEEINGHFLPRQAVADLGERLLAMSSDEICALPQVNRQRADIIGAGALVLRAFLERCGAPGLVASTRGIRYGLLLEMLAGRL